MLTSSVKEDKTKIVFRWQGSKLNLSAYSGSSHQVTWWAAALRHTGVTSCGGAAMGATAIAQEMSFPLIWVSPHSHTLTEWNKEAFSFQDHAHQVQAWTKKQA